jgi:hypothetical protein
VTIRRIRTSSPGAACAWGVSQGTLALIVALPGSAGFEGFPTPTLAFIGVVALLLYWRSILGLVLGLAFTVGVSSASLVGIATPGGDHWDVIPILLLAVIGSCAAMTIWSA